MELYNNIFTKIIFTVLQNLGYFLKAVVYSMKR